MGNLGGFFRPLDLYTRFLILLQIKGLLLDAEMSSQEECLE